LEYLSIYEKRGGGEVKSKKGKQPKIKNPEDIDLDLLIKSMAYFSQVIASLECDVVHFRLDLAVKELTRLKSQLRKLELRAHLLVAQRRTLVQNFKVGHLMMSSRLDALQLQLRMAEEGQKTSVALTVARLCNIEEALKRGRVELASDVSKSKYMLASMITENNERLQTAAQEHVSSLEHQHTEQQFNQLEAALNRKLNFSQ